MDEMRRWLIDTYKQADEGIQQARAADDPAKAAMEAYWAGARETARCGLVRLNEIEGRAQPQNIDLDE